MKLSGGDYVPDGAGGFVRCTGASETLMQALFRLSCRRGAFAFLPSLGSRLYTLAGEKPSVRGALARQYCAEALEGLGVTVGEVTVSARADGAMALRVELSAAGQTETLEVTI